MVFEKLKETRYVIYRESVFGDLVVKRNINISLLKALTNNALIRAQLDSHVRKKSRKAATGSVFFFNNIKHYSLQGSLTQPRVPDSGGALA